MIKIVSKRRLVLKRYGAYNATGLLNPVKNLRQLYEDSRAVLFLVKVGINDIDHAMVHRRVRLID